MWRGLESYLILKLLFKLFAVNLKWNSSHTAEKLDQVFNYICVMKIVYETLFNLI